MPALLVRSIQFIGPKMVISLRQWLQWIRKDGNEKSIHGSDETLLPPRMRQHGRPKDKSACHSALGSFARMGAKHAKKQEARLILQIVGALLH